MAGPVQSTSNPERATERRVVLGRIRTAVGLAGWVKVESYTDPADNLLKFPDWQIREQQHWRTLRLQNSRWSGRELRVQFAGIVDRNAAELLRNTEVAVFRHELPAAKPGEYYWDDLLGLAGLTKDGARLGVLDHFLDGPAHPFMVFRDGGTEHLVPLVKGRIVNADFDRRELVLDWTLDWTE